MNPGSPYWLINPLNPASPIWVARHAATRTAAQNAETHTPSPEEEVIMCIIVSILLIAVLALFGYAIYETWKEGKEQK